MGSVMLFGPIFWVYRKPMVAPQVAGASVVTGAVPLRTASKLSVLVIDDDQDIREYLQDFLNAEGFEVTTLADPSAAVERIRDEVFHLVVLDLMMPKISGLDLLQQIRAVDDDIAVIILTGYPSLETASASIQSCSA